MAENKIDRYIRTLPKALKPQVNPVLNALLKSWGIAHDDMVTQIANAKDQIFVATASGQYLDRLGSGVGFARPAEMGLFDNDYRKLIPIFSTEAKSVRKIFYDAMDVFWSPLFTRTNITSSNYAPFVVSPGDVLEISVDNGAFQSIKILAGDVASPGAATAEEVATVLGRIKGATASVILDQATGSSFVNLRTNTPGARGSLEIADSSLAGPGKLGFDLKKSRITDLPQRCVVWEIRPKELIIELPAIIPTLRRTLKGSHHIHADATLEGPIAPANGIWEGSFLYYPSGPAYTLTSQRAQIQEVLTEGNVYTKVTIDNGDLIENAPGNLIFGFGKADAESPVKFLGKPNNNTLLLDPGHVFQKSHLVGTFVNVLQATLTPAAPRTDGTDLGIYLTSPSGSRTIVQNLLSALAAAGVVVNFVVLLPQYEYLTNNPYSGA